MVKERAEGGMPSSVVVACLIIVGAYLDAPILHRIDFLPYFPVISSLLPSLLLPRESSQLTCFITELKRFLHPLVVISVNLSSF